MFQKVIVALLVSAFFTSVRSCASNGTDGAETCATSLGDETSLLQRKTKVKTNLHRLDEEKAAEISMPEHDSNASNLVGDQGFAERQECPLVDWHLPSPKRENQAILEMMNACLEEVDVKTLTHEQVEKLTKTTEKSVNSFDQTTCEGLVPPEVCPDIKHARHEGGICGAKIFKAKCVNDKDTTNGSPTTRVPESCSKKHALFRVFSKSAYDKVPRQSPLIVGEPDWMHAQAKALLDQDHRGFKNCESGGYWTASSPSGSMNREDFRKAYAICENWNPDLNMIAKWTFDDEACEEGQYVIIGNGEAVENCGSGEKYGFSKYLQVAITYPARDILSKESVEDWGH